MTFIYDQNETAPTNTYTGSYGSRVFMENTTIYMTGSFLRQVVADSATSFFSTGVLVGKKYLLSDYPNVFGSNKSKSNRSFSRFYTCVCNEEQFADTTLAHPLDYSAANYVSGGLMYNAGFAFENSDANQLDMPSFATTSSITLFIGTSSCTIKRSDFLQESFCDNIWNYTGPYQSRYKEITRLQAPAVRSKVRFSTVSASEASTDILRNGRNVTSSYVGIATLNFVTKSGGTNTWPDEYFSYGDFAASGVNTLDLVGSFEFGGIPPIVPYETFYIPNLSTRALYTCYFGFGDGIHNFPKGGLEFEVGTIRFIYNVIIRGWKYGLYNALPISSFVKFRYGRYGQMRDMLEQRPFTKFYTKNKFTDSPVLVSFVTTSTDYLYALDYVTATNPSYDPRDSGFWDYEYKCGHPFTDIDPID